MDAPRTPRSKLPVSVLVAALAGSLGAASPLVPEHPLSVGLPGDQQIAMERVARQPRELHPAILSVVVQEHLLVQLPAIWNDFDVSVRPLLGGYGENDQAALQDLLRHPGLIRDLVEGGPRSEAELRELLADYPESVHEIALVTGRDHFELLASIERRVERAIDAFEALISATSPATQRAFRAVVGQPELTSLLIDHIRVSERLAGAARIDRLGTLSQLAALGQAVEERQRVAEEQEARRIIAEERQRQERERRKQQRRLYYGRYPYWGVDSCWWGDPHYRHHPRAWTHRNRCWYPWNRYRRRWW